MSTRENENKRTSSTRKRKKKGYEGGKRQGATCDGSANVWRVVTIANPMTHQGTLTPQIPFELHLNTNCHPRQAVQLLQTRQADKQRRVQGRQLVKRLNLTLSRKRQHTSAHRVKHSLLFKFQTTISSRPEQQGQQPGSSNEKKKKKKKNDTGVSNRMTTTKTTQEHEKTRTRESGARGKGDTRDGGARKHRARRDLRGASCQRARRRRVRRKSPTHCRQQVAVTLSRLGGREFYGRSQLFVEKEP